MKIFYVTFSILCGIYVVAGDVSHLPSSSYLPPPKPEHAVSMSIEQQELRELPEQVEYMRESDQPEIQMDMGMPVPMPMPMTMPMPMPMPSSLLTPPAPIESDGMLPTRYLPPAPVAQQQQQQQPQQQQQQPQIMNAAKEESISQAAPTEPEPLMQPEPEQGIPMDYMTAMQYLAPVQQQNDQQQNQQLSYQQYQEQLQQQEMQQQLEYQQQQQQQQQQMPYILDVVQQPMAPSDAETFAYEEPQPAHELRNDGYHYKQAEEEQRLRH